VIANSIWRREPNNIGNIRGAAKSNPFSADPIDHCVEALILPSRVATLGIRGVSGKKAMSQQLPDHREAFLPEAISGKALMFQAIGYLPEADQVVTSLRKKAFG
jgi:hypothetical protein